MDKKRVLITGGASGLGKALALRFANSGFAVFIVDVNDERGAETLTELKAIHDDVVYQYCDVTNDVDFQKVRNQVLERWGGLDLLINNAGVGGTAGSIDKVTVEDWEWVWSINVLGVVRGCKVFTPLFKEQGYGYFVNIASAAGLLNAPYMSSYNTSKAAVISLSETLKIELSRYNIGVSVVCPAFFQTNLTENLRSEKGDMQSKVNRWMAASKISADDVAAAIQDAYQRKEFWVLTHPKERRLWKIKRFLPSVFDKMMLKQFTPVMQKSR